MEKIPVPGDHELSAAVSRLAGKLSARGLKLATAESCTAGWIAKCCTDLAGSSAWFERGFVSYSNAAKQQLLAVESSVLDREGAVSEAVARQMAGGAVTNSEADVSIAVTGIAGPDGGTAKKPVGTVWFGWGLANGEVQAECVCFDGDREAVRRHTVLHALEGLTARL
jgi:nicotinamide-nucleotide amidase